MTVHSAVKNQATVAVTAPASTVAFYLSTDARPGGGVRLAETRAVPALAKGRTSTGATRITIPSDTPPGTYFLLAVADDRRVVDESDEGNNARVAARAIAVKRPDLTVRSVTTKPARGVAGMNVKVRHVVRNVAAAPAHAPASTSRLVLSNNTALGDADDVDLGPVAVAALAAGAHAALTTTVSIPDGTAPGRYWIYAVANDGGFSEAATENNAARTTRPLTIGPDLLVTAANPSKTAPAPGMTVKVTTTVANQGGATPADFEVGIYLSVNGTLDASADTLLAARRVTGGLASGARSGPIVTPVVIPSTASPGTYFLIVRADAGGARTSGEVLEADETNNTRATAAIRIVRPDPTVPSVSSVRMP
jgi:subtilase family serine protease